MKCEFCEIDSEQLPGWKHEVRAPNASGTTEHLWHARFESMGVGFHVGVSVNRNPVDAVVAGGRPLITWKLKPISTSSRPLTDAVATGAAATVGVAADLMLAPTHHDPRPRGQRAPGGFFSRLDRWAWNIVRPRDTEPLSSLPAVELAVSPF